MKFTDQFFKALVNESEKILQESGRIDTSPYETINDKSPSGKGIWTFGIDVYPNSPAAYAKLEKEKKIVDYNDDYNFALKKVHKDFPNAKTIYLLP